MSLLLQHTCVYIDIYKPILCTGASDHKTKSRRTYLMIHDGSQAHDADMDVIPSFAHVEFGGVLGRSRGANGVGAPQVAPRTAAQPRVQAGRLFVVQQLLSPVTSVQSNL